MAYTRTSPARAYLVRPFTSLGYSQVRLNNHRIDINAPKPNKRFLSSIIRSTDDHNKSILRAQAMAAQEAREERQEQEKRESRAGWTLAENMAAVGEEQRPGTRRRRAVIRTRSALDRHSWASVVSSVRPCFLC